MKNKSNYYNLIWPMLLMAFIGSLLAACSKMNDTYKDFIKDGQIIYPGKADSARVHSGRNRLILSWPASTDPKVTKAKIYWNNRTDSIEIPVEPKSADQPTISVPFNDLLEGSYTFEIFTFDKNGNQSVKVETLGRAYGDIYENALLSRPIDIANFENDTLKIFWGAVPDTTAVRSEFIYTDKDGIEQEIFISKESGTTEIPHFVAPSMIKHRTVYLPNQWAIDTFYTEYTSQRIKGLPIELSKAGWEATASSFDSRSGSRYRPPSLAIDGDPTTIWVNQVSPQEEYPHTITVDMGSVRDEIEGFAIITRVGDASARPKTVELLTSEDDVEDIDDDLNWHTHGEYILEDTGDLQFIALPGVVKARHFRLIAKDPHKAGNNIALAEVGLYTR